MSDIDDLRRARDQAVEIARNLLATPGLPATPTLQTRLDEIVAVGIVAPTAPRPPPPYEDGYVCGNGFDDAESASWTYEVYATREEAITAGNADVGWRAQDEGFETARISASWNTMPNPFNAESECDRAECDDWGEAMLEHWLDKVFANDGKLLDELQAELDTVWERFESRHELGSWGYYFDDIESHPFGDEPDEDEPVVLEAPAATVDRVDDALIENANEVAEHRKTESGKTGSVSDGYHTFDELYAHRGSLFIALCAEVDARMPTGYVWRSKKHSDGTMFDGWFVMGIGTEPGEQITYHLPIERWPDTEQVGIKRPTAPVFDGHTSDDVLERLKRFAR